MLNINTLDPRARRSSDVERIRFSWWKGRAVTQVWERAPQKEEQDQRVNIQVGKKENIYKGVLDSLKKEVSTLYNNNVTGMDPTFSDQISQLKNISNQNAKRIDKMEKIISQQVKDMVQYNHVIENLEGKRAHLKNEVIRHKKVEAENAAEHKKTLKKQQERVA